MVEAQPCQQRLNQALQRTPSASLTHSLSPSDSTLNYQVATLPNQAEVWRSLPCNLTSPTNKVIVQSTIEYSATGMERVAFG